MKYLNTMVTFSEFPDEIALCINITGCPFHCPGCHSPELWEDVGIELNYDEVEKLINKNKGITCIGFMGGNPQEIGFVGWIKQFYPNLKIGWYWGGNCIPTEVIQLNDFDYIKIGRYKKELGGLDNPNTNQRFYKIENGQLIDWTYKFWKHGNKNNN